MCVEGGGIFYRNPIFGFSLKSSVVSKTTLGELFYKTSQFLAMAAILDSYGGQKTMVTGTCDNKVELISGNIMMS